MPQIISQKIKIGISACNAGAKVRYDRKGWDRLQELGRERDAFIWTPVCPEVLAGLGVPREPMKLSGGNGDDFWNGQARAKNRRGQDVGENLKQGSLAALEALKRAGVEAFVYMDGSPSCGVYRTTLKAERLGKPPGVFGSLLLKEQIFLIPALDIMSPLRFWDWRRRLMAFVWLKRAELATKQSLIETWHVLKFLCQEIDRARADALSVRIASMPARYNPVFVEEIRAEMLALLRLPSSEKRIEGAVRKNMAFFRKHYGGPSEMEMPKAERGKRAYLAELIALEKRAIADGLDYGFVPVIYRDRSR
jgi:uncharacterized protein YbbK (DUF523 family)